ncbi:hypothetical protein HQ529_00750 [Candidatus Woesearchaeota archaeon]|nr:hypothetical protein [Candidatus Woesearchaeota archaeon]
MIPIAPLTRGFMLTAIVGFFISIFLVYPKSPTLGFTFILIFMLMFIASVVSMTYADADDIIRMEKRKR